MDPNVTPPLDDGERKMLIAVRAALALDPSTDETAGQELADRMRLSLGGKVGDLEIVRVLLALATDLGRSAQANPYITGLAQRFAIAAVELLPIEVELAAGQ